MSVSPAAFPSPGLARARQALARRSSRRHRIDRPTSASGWVCLLAFLVSAWPVLADRGPDASAAEVDAAEPVAVGEWLQIGPWSARMPALAPEEYGLDQWLAEADLDLDHLAPGAGRTVAVPAFGPGGSEQATWTRAVASQVETGADSADDRLLELSLRVPSDPGARSGDGGSGDGGSGDGGSGDANQRVAVAWMATYLEVDRFTHATLTVHGTGAARVLLDGEEVATRSAAEAKSSTEDGSDAGAEAEDAESDDPPGDDGASPTTAELVLSTGQHLLLIESASTEPRWTVGASLAGHGVTLDLDPRRGIDLDDLLDTVQASNPSLSPDGRTVAISYRTPAVPAEHVERWIELVDTDTGEVVRTLRGGESSFAWHPRGEGYVFAGKGETGQNLYRARAGSGRVEVLAREIEHLSSLRFLPDGSALVLEINEPSEPDERGVKRYRALPDRWTGWRERTHLHLLGLDATRLRLTVGNQEDGLLDISPDSRRLLLRRVERGITERPFSQTELLELDLRNLETRSIATLGWFGSAHYSPDGESLAITGSAALFEGAGNPLGAEVVANDYDTQAYLYDLDSGEVRAISRDFAPAIDGLEWSRHDGALYLDTQDGDRSRLYRYWPENARYELLETAVDVISGPSLARSADLVAYVGQSPNRPPAIYVRGLAPDAVPRLLVDPAAEAYADVVFGETRDWSFVASDGTEIEGRVYLPTGFDPAKKYPLIVYYYGGTVPVSRSFGGRYPKELWAANGYVVYVPQPSGATGFGAEFAARHVNAWGRRTADEILEGTEKFVAAHDFVDEQKIGAIGASYGGFMTMYLQTRTDLFAAAISHAGISNLSSYWGKGWWGYLYSAAASADRYPWNDPQLYTEQSPLYAADRIQTPLLLLHGDADTNVPPSESHQMYTALEVLGKEVELIEIGGENHTILTYEKRRLWASTILAWFDRYLRGQPAAWEHLWGTDDDPKG